VGEKEREREKEERERVGEKEREREKEERERMGEKEREREKERAEGSLKSIEDVLNKTDREFQVREFSCNPTGAAWLRVTLDIVINTTAHSYRNMTITRDFKASHDLCVIRGWKSFS